MGDSGERINTDKKRTGGTFDDECNNLLDPVVPTCGSVWMVTLFKITMGMRQCFWLSLFEWVGVKYKWIEANNLCYLSCYIHSYVWVCFRVGETIFTKKRETLVNSIPSTVCAGERVCF
jgi:hypothetical protein